MSSDVTGCSFPYVSPRGLCALFCDGITPEYCTSRVVHTSGGVSDGGEADPSVWFLLLGRIAGAVGGSASRLKYSSVVRVFFLCKY